MRTFLIFFSSVIITFSCLEKDRSTTNPENRPNFIIIYADDLGYGDLGCFGATDINTPNIDKLANDGMKFTEFYSASPVCSPSRAALMTGRYPVRMGIYGVFFPDSYYGINPTETTIAELLQDAGYATGHIGKWHLGSRFEYLPLQNGFDEYFGIPYSNDMNQIMYMRNNQIEKVEVDQRYTTKTYTEEALNFIDAHLKEPFFLYLAHNMPHVPIYASENFEGKSARGLYGDVIEEMDWGVGQILQKLKESDLTERTLIIFSSDNGPWLVMRDHGGSAGKLREGKQYTFEGGMRVPTLVCWPGNIKAGSTYDNLAVMMDWYPTISNLAGITVPAHILLDGEDITPVLVGNDVRKGKELAYYDGNQLRAYRNGDWKIKRPYEGYQGAMWKKPVQAHEWLLYDLKNDPEEKINLAEKNPQKFQALKDLLQSFEDRMGQLPPSVMTQGSGPDTSHFKYLIEKYGEDFWKMN